MRKFFLYFFATATILSVAIEQAHALVITSTFEADAEGWRVGDVTSSTAPSGSIAPIYNSAGGNPGGYISTLDRFTNVAFLAPSELSRAYRTVGPSASI